MKDDKHSEQQKHGTHSLCMPLVNKKWTQEHAATHMVLCQQFTVEEPKQTWVSLLELEPICKTVAAQIFNFLVKNAHPIAEDKDLQVSRNSQKNDTKWMTNSLLQLSCKAMSQH